MKITLEGQVMRKDTRQKKVTEETIFYIDMFQDGELKLVRADLPFDIWDQVEEGKNIKVTGVLFIWSKGGGYTFIGESIEQ